MKLRTRSLPYLLTSLLSLPLLAAGCDETDATSIRVKLAADLTGTVAMSAMAIPADAGAAEKAASGIDWQARTTLTLSGGRFKSLGDIKVADIQFSCRKDEDGTSFLKVTLPRGAQAHWPATLAVPAADKRKATTTAFDPAGRIKDVGAQLKIVVELPVPPISTGVSPKIRGSDASIDGKTATLLLPLEGALQEGEPAIWHLTWK